MVNRTAAGRYGVRLALAVALTTAVPCLGVQASAYADPAEDATVADGGSHLVSTDPIDDRQSTIHVYSASMDREIPLRVITPADTSAPRPTLYLLNGAGGGEDSATWQARTDVVDFFADKNVNVVTPMEGAFSYYTDWEQTDPELGNNKWTTFLTQELPPIVDSALGTNGVNSIAGISMAGSSVLSLAQSAPDLYQSVGAYSGCAMTSTDPGRAYVRMVVEGRGGGDTSNMWGPEDGPGVGRQRPVHQRGEAARTRHLCQQRIRAARGGRSAERTGNQRRRRNARQPDPRRRRHRGRHQPVHPCAGGQTERTADSRDVRLPAHRHPLLDLLAGRPAQVVADARRVDRPLASGLGTESTPADPGSAGSSRLV